jgi:hypothetical protein
MPYGLIVFAGSPSAMVYYRDPEDFRFGGGEGRGRFDEDGGGRESDRPRKTEGGDRYYRGDPDGWH